MYSFDESSGRAGLGGGGERGDLIIGGFGEETEEVEGCGSEVDCRRAEGTGGIMIGPGLCGARGAVVCATEGEVITRGEEKEVRGEMGIADSRKAVGLCCDGKLLVCSSWKATDGGERRSISSLVHLRES